MLAAAVATALAFALYARFEWPWCVLGWVGLVPWLLALDRVRSARETLAAGLVASVAFVLAVFGWFATAIQTYTGAPWAGGLVVLAVMAPLLEPQLPLAALARHAAGTASGERWLGALAGACAWVGTEWASPKLFGDTLGYGLYPAVWMRQGADVAGVHGLTFVLLLGNECVAAAIRGGPRRDRVLRRLAGAAALALALGAYGALRCRQLDADPSPLGTVTAGIVQADIRQYDRLAAQLGTYDAVRTILDTHFALSDEARARRRLDLLVWPETAYPTTFGSPKSADGAAFDREIAGYTGRAGVPLVFGAYDVEGGDEFNAAVFLAPPVDGRVAFDTYRKAWLFPLTERVPALLESGLLRSWMPWLGTWKAGAGPAVLPLGLADGRTVRVAPLICYDVLDPGFALAAVRRGAELIVTLSNDSWLAGGPGPHLHLVGAVFRSIETRRPQLRATNTGISAVITPLGDVIAVAGVGERAALVATVAPRRGSGGPLVAVGDWFGPAALAGAVVLVAVGLVRRAQPDAGP
jgi:apolipoprotein N-acyltransferase